MKAEKLLLTHLFVAGGQLLTAVPASLGQNGATCYRSHTLAESVLVGSLAFAGLVGAFHDRIWFSKGSQM